MKRGIVNEFFRSLLLGGLLLSVTAVHTRAGVENPVPPLPDDNLLSHSDAWFRDESGTEGGWSNWKNVDENGSISQGQNKNPSPDAHDGTAVQWDLQTGCAPQENCFSYLIVEAPDLHNAFKFSWWNVVLNMELFEFNIYGCLDSECKEQTQIALFVPQNPGPIWSQSEEEVVETAVSYPFYQLEMHCRYQAGAQFGCKATGIYFSTFNDGDGDPPLPPPSQNDDLYLPLIYK